MYRITFLQIHYFLTVAKTLNFTQAASLLYISQPALSKQILSIEGELGLVLFERNKRTVMLTPAGASLYKEWALLEADLNASIARAKLLQQNEAKTLRIGCTDTFPIDEALSLLMERFQTQYPDIDIDIGSYGFRTLKEQFQSGDFDVIFIPEFELSAYKGVKTLPFQTVDLCIAVPLSHPLSKKKEVTVSDLKEQPIITISPKESVKGVEKIKNLCQDYGFEPNIVKYMSNLNSLLLGVRNGIGITICDNKINDRNIKTYDLKEQPRDSNIVAVWKATTDHKEIQLFIETIQSMQM
ncbi:MAG: hypothetical protein PWP24_1330 [Clostridiales bacterium]|nr:hypothetical protein [Clostridiales bacterium]